MQITTHSFEYSPMTRTSAAERLTQLQKDPQRELGDVFLRGVGYRATPDERALVNSVRFISNRPYVSDELALSLQKSALSALAGLVPSPLMSTAAGVFSQDGALGSCERTVRRLDAEHAQHEAAGHTLSASATDASRQQSIGLLAGDMAASLPSPFNFWPPQ